MDFAGKKVLVTTAHRGVFFGTLKERTGDVDKSAPVAIPATRDDRGRPIETPGFVFCPFCKPDNWPRRPRRYPITALMAPAGDAVRAGAYTERRYLCGDGHTMTIEAMDGARHQRRWMHQV